MNDQPKAIQDDKEQERLRALAFTIKELFILHDVAGCLVLQGRHSTEFVMDLTPSWSAFSIERQPDGSEMIRFKCRMKTGAAAEREKGRISAGMLMAFLIRFSRLTAMLESVAEMVQRHLQIDHVSEPSNTHPMKPVLIEQPNEDQEAKQ